MGHRAVASSQDRAPRLSAALPQHTLGFRAPGSGGAAGPEFVPFDQPRDLPLTHTNPSARPRGCPARNETEDSAPRGPTTPGERRTAHSPAALRPTHGAATAPSLRAPPGAAPLSPQPVPTWSGAAQLAARPSASAAGVTATGWLPAAGCESRAASL